MDNESEYGDLSIGLALNVKVHQGHMVEIIKRSNWQESKQHMSTHGGSTLVGCSAAEIHEINRDIVETSLEKAMRAFATGKTEDDVACIARAQALASVFCSSDFVDEETESGLKNIKKCFDSDVDGSTSFDLQDAALKSIVALKGDTNYNGVCKPLFLLHPPTHHHNHHQRRRGKWPMWPIGAARCPGNHRGGCEQKVKTSVVV